MVKISSRVRVLLIAGAVCAYIAPSVTAQTQSANEKAYHILLQQIADKKITIAHKQVFIAGAQDQAESLKAQIDGLGDVKASVQPMLDKMVAGIEREIAADFPFKKDARLARLNRLKTMVANDKISVGEKYRNALNIYKIEVNYGQSLEAYKGNHPISPTIRLGEDRYLKDEKGEFEINKKTNQKIEIFDGDYLRYGRTALVYLNVDGSDPYRYDLENGEWVSLSGAGTSVRRAIRIAYGEVAPGVVMAPVTPSP
ncbi:MAG: DUF3450 domain-containing protein [Robiginitomaculum sp.]|nr:DUF3450 domain-containing protein [Robiginitomaculum sp.]